MSTPKTSRRARGNDAATPRPDNSVLRSLEHEDPATPPAPPPPLSSARAAEAINTRLLVGTAGAVRATLLELAVHLDALDEDALQQALVRAARSLGVALCMPEA